MASASISSPLPESTTRNSPDVDESLLFQHQPLDLRTTTIRLVEILEPGPNNAVRCKIRHVTIEAPHAQGSIPDYTCLSYVWGPPEDTEWITVNGKPFEVRRNLFDFLQVASTWKMRGSEALDTVSKDGTPRLDINRCIQSLWVDALCIDQSEVLERNHQVQQMGWIYSNAAQVISWLGDNPNLASLLLAISHEGDARELLASEDSWLVGLFCYDVYWKRAWITQEVHLARNLHLLSQDASIPLTALERVATKMEKRSRTWQYNALEKFVSKLQRKDKSVTLLENIWSFQNKECSDARDLVYSLISLSVDGARLHVDYGCSITQVAKNVLRLYESSMCFCKASVVVRALRLYSLLPYDPALLWIEAHDVSTAPTTRCQHCNQDISRVQERIWSFFIKTPTTVTYGATEKKYICLRCNHADFSGYPFRVYSDAHLVLVRGISCIGRHVRWQLFSDGAWFTKSCTEGDLYRVDGEVKGIKISASLIHEIAMLRRFEEDVNDMLTTAPTPESRLGASRWRVAD